MKYGPVIKGDIDLYVDYVGYIYICVHICVFIYICVYIYIWVGYYPSSAESNGQENGT